MARAHAIWVVVEEVDYEAFWVQAAFTVKHELITWLKANNMTDDQVIRIWKKDDGLRQVPLDYKMFLSPEPFPNVFKPSDLLGA